MGDQRVVDFQKQVRTIAFARESVLIALRLNGYGDLSGDEFDELEIEMIVSAGLVRPEIHDAELLVGGGHRHTANRFYRALEQYLRKRKAIVVLQIADHDGFLVPPNPSRNRAFHRHFRRILPFGRLAGFEYVEPHDVAGRVVEHDAEV